MLYDKNPFNDITVYFNHQMLECIYFAKCEHFISEEDYKEKFHNDVYEFLDIQNINEKDVARIQDLSEENLQSFYGAIESYKPKKCDPKNIKYMLNYALIDKYITNIFKRYKEKGIHFDLILYPASTLGHKLLEQYCTISVFMEYYRHIVLNAPDNVTIYAFNDTDWVDDIDNYLDYVHYTNNTSTNYIFKAIKDKTNIITKNNIEKYLKKVREKFTNYDIQKDKEKIDIERERRVKLSQER
jgi:hypothetical protein